MCWDARQVSEFVSDNKVKSNQFLRTTSCLSKTFFKCLVRVRGQTFNIFPASSNVHSPFVPGFYFLDVFINYKYINLTAENRGKQWVPQKTTLGQNWLTRKPWLTCSIWKLQYQHTYVAFPGWSDLEVSYFDKLLRGGEAAHAERQKDPSAGMAALGWILSKLFADLTVDLIPEAEKQQLSKINRFKTQNKHVQNTLL